RRAALRPGAHLLPGGDRHLDAPSIADSIHRSPLEPGVVSGHAVLTQVDIVGAGVPALVDALHSHLASLADLIATLDGSTYRAAPSRTSGSIGEHVRHCLDHAKALVFSVDDDTICYDSRLRGTSVERIPSLAIAEIERVCRDLARLDEFVLERPILL